MLSDTYQSGRLRAIVLIALGGILIWQVTMRSFVAFLAVEVPEAALNLDSTEPRALVALADRRLNLGSQAPAENTPPQDSDDTVEISRTGDRLAGWAEIALKLAASRLLPSQTPTAPSPNSWPSLDEAEREAIRNQAESALLQDPLNAKGLRILAQLADRADQDVRALKLMEHAARLSLRESGAVLWLMQASLEKGNYAVALKYTDRFLRKRPQLIRFAIPILAKMVENKDQEPVNKLKALLANNPPWRSNFFAALPGAVSNARTPLDLLLSIKETPVPPTDRDINGYLKALARANLHELAYYTWLQFLPPRHLASVGPLFNGSFEFPLSGLPFDWTISRGAGVTIDVAQRPDQGDARALFLEFGPGRAQFDGVAQLLMLAPGEYIFKGKLKGEISGRRGMQWRIVCADKKTRLVESNMFLGVASTWTEFEMKFTVPEADCRAQELRLVHAARSASEQLVTGSIWYDELNITRVMTPSPQQPASDLGAAPQRR